MPDGVFIPGGPSFSGQPQPPDVPCDPTGEGWRGPPGPQGPPGVGFDEAPADGTSYGRVGSTQSWNPVLPLSGGTLTGQLILPNGTTAAPALNVGPADGTGFSRNGNVLITSVQGTMINASFGAGLASSQYYVNLSMLNNRITQLGDATAAADALNQRSGDARYTLASGGPFLPLTGGTVSGATTFSSGLLIGSGVAGGQTIGFVTAAGNNRYTQYFSGGTGAANIRWRDGVTNDAESGSNAGATRFLAAHDDSGASLGNVYTVTRATRQTQFFGPLVTNFLSMGGPAGNGQSITWPFGASDGPAASPLFMNATWTGTGAAAQTNNLNKLIINDAITGRAGGMNGFGIYHTVGGAGAQGARSAFYANMTANNTLNLKLGGQFIVSGTFYSNATVNAGGTDFTSVSNSVGALCGVNPYISLGSGATFWQGASGIEIDVSMRAGSSYGNVNGLLIATISGHAVAGAFGTNTAIAIGGNGLQSAGWNYGLMFGLASSQWQYQTNATLIGAAEPQSPFVAQANAAWGVDFQGVNFSSGFARSVGFLVDGIGNLTAQTTNLGNWSLTPSSSGLAINNVGQRATAVSVAAAGTLVTPGDKLTTTTGGMYQVATASVLTATVNNGGSGGTNGAVTVTGTTGTGTKFQATGTITGGVLTGALTVTVAGNYTVSPTQIGEPVTGGGLVGATVNLGMGALTVTQLVADTSASPPSNPVATTATNTHLGGFYGTGATGVTLNLTWSAASALSLNPSGGAVSVRGVTISPMQRLFYSAPNTGNGADLTEDTLASFTIPAAALLNVGDTLKVIAVGAFIGSTDSKNARVRIGALAAATPVTTAATNTTWRIEVTMTKSASNTQQTEIFSAMSGGAGTQVYTNAQSGIADTAPIAFSVTGQNTTNSVANSVTLRFVMLDLIRA